jgi:glycosyltransferase involved in cell wall biosynthesis
MMPTVSAVIPTVGRPSLWRAVESALNQSWPVVEVIVVADADATVDLPSDARITLLHTPFRQGATKCRQLGIDAARGSAIALLDDDDEWYSTKLERQLTAVGPDVTTPWIGSSRIAVVGPGDRHRVWPRRLIQQRQSVADYLFRFTGLRFGGAVLQSSTLCFPTDLARRYRWDVHAGAVHDEPSWLMAVQRAVPDLRMIQVPDVLSTYNVGHGSMSRDPAGNIDDYIEWGLRYLSNESSRLLGDYLCTSPVSAAVAARSLIGVRRSVQSAIRHGRPGLWALGYATLSAARIASRRFEAAVRR